MMTLLNGEDTISIPCVAGTLIARCATEGESDGFYIYLSRPDGVFGKIASIMSGQDGVYIEYGSSNVLNDEIKRPPIDIGTETIDDDNNDDSDDDVHDSE